MKYGILAINRKQQNLGDIMQTYGAINMFEHMGVNAEDLLKVDYSSTYKYDGESVLIPTNRFWNNSRGEYTPLFSDKIIPVFFGFHTYDPHILEQLYRYKHFGPFGCRDLETARMLRRAGFDAYMSGCLSLIFERRAPTDKQTKAFFIDALPEVNPFVPKDILDNFEVLSMSRNYDHAESFDDALADLKALIKKVVDEAKLVVTKRIHVALPFMSMGIPVVFLNPNKDELLDWRFSGYSRFLKIYCYQDFDKIDWQPEVPNIEKIKQKTINCACNMIQRAYEKYSDLCDINDYYENEPPHLYYGGVYASYLTVQQKRDFINRSNTEDFMRERTMLEFITNKKLSETHLVFFGSGNAARYLVRRFDDYIRAALSFDMVDNDINKHGKPFCQPFDLGREYDPSSPIENYLVKSPSVLSNYLSDKRTLLIIIAVGKYYEAQGRQIGEQLLSLGLKEGKDFFFLDKLNNTMNLPLAESARVFSNLDVL